MALRVVVFVPPDTDPVDDYLLRGEIERRTHQTCHVRISRERDVPCVLAVISDFVEVALPYGTPERSSS